MCQAFVNSFASLVACRICLGLFESAVSPGQQHPEVLIHALTCRRGTLLDIHVLLFVGNPASLCTHLVSWFRCGCIWRSKCPLYLNPLSHFEYSHA